MSSAIDRRSFLNLMGAAGLATFTGCGGEAPTKRIVPHLVQPEGLVPGVTTRYASVCGECPAGCGIVVATRDGRPIKIEGNPAHPRSRGALCARGQAALQGLYSPDRVRHPLRKPARGGFAKTTWEESLASLGGTLRELGRAGSLDRVALVTPHLSGSLERLVRMWVSEHPGASLHRHEAISYEPIVKAAEICFGRAALPRFRIEDADLVASFGADFLETWLSPVEYAAAFSRTRAYREGKIGLLIYIGSRHGLTAANADEVVPIRPGTCGALALGIIRVILEERLRSLPAPVDRSALNGLVAPYDAAAVYRITDVPPDRVMSLARRIARAPRCVALPGGVEHSGSNATENAVALNLLNYVLGAFGSLIEVPDDGPLPAGPGLKDLPRLIERMRRGEIGLLLLLGVNPAYSVPAASGFLEGLERVRTVVCCSDAFNETTAVSDLVLPIHHPLEAWGDSTPGAGIYGLMQPGVRPLGDSRHPGEVLIGIARASGLGSGKLSVYETYYDFLLDAWRELAQARHRSAPFEGFWEAALRRGGWFTEPEVRPVALSPDAFRIPYREPTIEDAPGPDGPQEGHGAPAGRVATLIVYPSLLRYDGRGANRSWLQEVPDPVLQNVWGSCVEVSTSTAADMGLSSGDVVRVSSAHGSIECPVYVSGLVYSGAVALALGQGHRGYGRGADGAGVNALDLLPLSQDELSGGQAYLRVKVRLQKTGRVETIPTPQGHPYDEGRGVVRSISLASMVELTSGRRGRPGDAEHGFRDLLEPHEHPKHRWGMAIDLNACIGCSACVVACYAENNIPVVGKEQFRIGREMAWIRIERFLREDRPGDTRFLPMLCQQCENAPCEPVCPVYATYHTEEGLNAQVYNRCVGTRYCANNCPYSARRFNWFSFRFPEPLNLQLNPDVTVRSKGVMEKCTFCVQRIVLAKDRAKDQDRDVKDGEIVPACAQTCPTKAITFGDLKDPDSLVSRKTRDPRGYRVFEHLNTKPAITYLKKITAGDGLV